MSQVKRHSLGPNLRGREYSEKYTCSLPFLYGTDGVVVVQCMKIIEPRCEKTNVLVSDQVRHKPGYTAKEDD